jgi:hypothetical protein
MVRAGNVKKVEDREGRFESWVIFPSFFFFIIVIDFLLYLIIYLI